MHMENQSVNPVNPQTAVEDVRGIGERIAISGCIESPGVLDIGRYSVPFRFLLKSMASTTGAQGVQ